MSLLLAASASPAEGNFGNLTSSDYIYIGADGPFWGVYFEMLSHNSGATLPFQTAEYSAGSSSWTSMTAKDSTMALTSDGCIAFLPTADIVGDGSWIKDTVDGSEKYWIRLAPDNIMTSTQIANIYICPYRPPIDADVFPHSGQAIAGVLPKILVGTWRGEEITWQDTWTLEASRIMQMRLSRVRGSASIGKLNLWAFCQDDIYHMAVGPEAHSARASWPLTNGGPHLLATFATDFGRPMNTKQVNRLVVTGEFLQSDDGFYVYWAWDNDDRWYRSGPHTACPIVLDLGEDAGKGRTFGVVAALNDATRDAVAFQGPYIYIPSEADGGWTDLGPEHQAVGGDIQSPQAR